MELSGLVAQLAVMAGFASFVAILVNVLKFLGIVHDGTSRTWALGFNVVGLVGLYLLGIFAPGADVSQIDGIFGGVTQILVIVMQLVVQLGISIGANGVVKTLPVIGYSYSDNQQKELMEKSFGNAKSSGP